MMRGSQIIPTGPRTQVTPANGEFIVYGHSKPRVPKYRHSLGGNERPANYVRLQLMQLVTFTSPYIGMTSLRRWPQACNDHTSSARRPFL
jgi:hypothetical protein